MEKVEKERHCRSDRVMSWLKRNYQIVLFKWFNRRVELIVWGDEFWPDWKSHFTKEDYFWFVNFGPLTFSWSNTKKLYEGMNESEPN